MSQEEVFEEDKYGVAIIDVPFGWSQKILASQKMANLVIIISVFLTGLAFLGIGFLTTRPFAPVEAGQVPVEQIAAAGQQ